MNLNHDFDYVIIGSGFGGSVSALRLSEKGYRVLVIEKGKWFKASDFPKTSWNVKRWFWVPVFRFYGFFKLTFMKHITILSGVGVGGGSLVYANTLPIPKGDFFTSDTWAHLADWQNELRDHYDTALRMLGATPNPKLQKGDLALKKLAEDIGRADQFEVTNVAVFFGEADEIVPDPYFNGNGPERSGCNFCGGCMVGCRYNAKNTLDKNYLYFARKNGAKIQAESEVYDVVPLDENKGVTGYEVSWKSTTRLIRKKGKIKCKGVIFAGGVLGTVKLLLRLCNTSLPDISDKIGDGIRTNSESLIGITSTKKGTVFSEGVAIGSILHTDDNSHLEPVRYPSGSGFWRILMSPMVHAPGALRRMTKIIAEWLIHPVQNLKTYFVWDWAKHTQILLFMQTINSTLHFSSGWFGMRSTMEAGPAPTAFIPEAKSLAEKYSKIVDGRPTVLLTETLMGRPTTAHILGGAIMGENAREGVIDKDNRVFGYRNMYICDGSTISSNPGVNPALTITALSERAMSKIASKDQTEPGN